MDNNPVFNGNIIILDNNREKLFVKKKENSLYEYTLLDKQTSNKIGDGVYNQNEFAEIINKYNYCFIDGYAYDLISGTFD